MLYLWSLRPDLAGTGEGAVHFTHDCGLGALVGGVA
jgi:hypothetical protein